MNSALDHTLLSEINVGGQAYIRNLVAAKAAVLQGQFNVAKILRGPEVDPLQDLPCFLQVT